MAFMIQLILPIKMVLSPYSVSTYGLISFLVFSALARASKESGTSTIELRGGQNLSKSSKAPSIN
jgi:hypothetical protein